MSTHMPGLLDIVLAKLATSSIRVKKVPVATVYL